MTLLRTVLLIVLTATLAAAVGCSTIKRTWKWTVETVNPKPQVDLDVESLSDETHERLAMYFAPIDERITKLQRFVNVQEDYPDDSWFEVLFNRFPWVGGALTVERSGEVLTKRPAQTLKPLKLEPLLAMEADWNEPGVRARIDETELGPEIYFANAFTKDREWLGLTVVHFDFRSLVDYSPNPEQLIVVADGIVLWGGDENHAARLLAERPWDKLLKDAVLGTWRADDGASYLWLARHLGGTHLIYATREAQGE